MKIVSLIKVFYKRFEHRGTTTIRQNKITNNDFYFKDNIFRSVRTSLGLKFNKKKDLCKKNSIELKSKFLKIVKK